MNERARIKVLFWPGWWYPDRRNPMNGIFIRRHAEAVAPLVDLAVLYVTADPGLSGHAYGIEAVMEPVGLTVRAYYRPLPARFRWLRVMNAWRYYRAARRGIRELHGRWGRPEVIHLHVSPPGGQILALRAYFPRTPFLFTEHWTGYHAASHQYRGRIRKLINSWVVKNALVVTPVSRNLQQVMESHGLRGRFAVIPNAVRTDLFHPAAARESRKPFTFLHVSHLAPAKNIGGILRAAASLRTKRWDFRLVIAGDGVQRASLEELAARLSLDRETVNFTGRKNEDELAEIMRQADCFVLFSDYENLPCVIAEAMASGLPVIATRVGGVPEQVMPGMGVLLQPQDEAGLRQAMDAMIDEAGTFNQAAIRDFAVENYSHPEVGKRFLAFYQEAARSQARPS